jgi:ParB/RepB/Spo0J family partition protein
MKDDVFYIKKEDIVASGWNPRTEADKEEFERLKESITALGIRIPLIVRPKGKGKHPLIAGERRWKAAKKGTMLPCIVQTGDELDAKLTTLIENFVRENVSNEDHEKFIAQIYADGWKKRWNNHKEMSKVTGLPQWLIETCIEAYGARMELGLGLIPEVSRNVTTADIRESAGIKDAVVRRKLLEKRAMDKQKTTKDDTILKGEGHIVHHTSKKLSQVPHKVAMDYLDGKIPEKLLDVVVEAKKHGKTDNEISEVLAHVSEEHMTKALEEGSIIRARGILVDDVPEKILILEGSKEERELSKFRQSIELARRMTTFGIKRLKDEKLKSEAIYALKYLVKNHTGILLELGQPIPYVTLEKGKIVEHDTEAEQP